MQGTGPRLLPTGSGGFHRRYPRSLWARKGRRYSPGRVSGPLRGTPPGGRDDGHARDLQADRLEGALGLAGGRAGGQHVVAHHHPDPARGGRRAGAGRAPGRSSSRPGWRPGRPRRARPGPRHRVAAAAAAGRCASCPAAAEQPGRPRRDGVGGVVPTGPDGGRARRHRHEHDGAGPGRGGGRRREHRGQRPDQAEQPPLLETEDELAGHAVVRRAGPGVDQAVRHRVRPGQPGPTPAGRRRTPGRAAARAHRSRRTGRRAGGRWRPSGTSSRDRCRPGRPPAVTLGRRELWTQPTYPRLVTSSGTPRSLPAGPERSMSRSSRGPATA